MKQDDMFMIYVYPFIPLEQMHVFVHLLHQCYIQYTVYTYIHTWIYLIIKVYVKFMLLWFVVWYKDFKLMTGDGWFIRGWSGFIAN